MFLVIGLVFSKGKNNLQKNSRINGKKLSSAKNCTVTFPVVMRNKEYVESIVGEGDTNEYRCYVIFKTNPIKGLTNCILRWPRVIKIKAFYQSFCYSLGVHK